MIFFSVSFVFNQQKYFSLQYEQNMKADMSIVDDISYAESLLNILPDGIIILTFDERVLQVNLQAKTGLHINVTPDYSERDIYIGELFELIHRDENILAPALEAIRQDCDELVLPVNTSIREKSTNTIFPVKGRFCRLPIEEGEDAIVFYFRNVTSELTQEYILNSALNRTRIYPWFFDLDRKVFSLDARYFEYLGIEPEPGYTLSMERYVSLIHPDDRQQLFDAFSVQFSGETMYDKPVPFRILRGDGKWEWFEGQSTYIGKLSGLPYRLVGICMSIQEHKDIEETLIAARVKAEEGDRLKTAFLANMSHEIRTPLNAIVGFSDVLSSTFQELSSQEREEFVSLINVNSEHLLRLINDILDLSKIESNTMEFVFAPCSLRDLMNEILAEQNLTPLSGELQVTALLPEEDLCIVTDASRLKQVICNLLNNSRKFTKKGYINFGYAWPGEEKQVELFVEDTGEGIASEHLDHIFERFYKVNSFKQGTGLGLSICQTIVEHLHGKIAVYSTMGRGTRFTVTLPL